MTISLLLSYNTPGDQHGYAMLDAANVLARVPGLTPTLIDAARALIAAQRLSIARATDGRRDLAPPAPFSLRVQAQCAAVELRRPENQPSAPAGST